MQKLPLVIAGLGLVLTAVSAPAQQENSQERDPLLRRWVGHHQGRPIWLDFYSDSMLVVNDEHALDFWFTWDSLVAWGDTSFAVRYRFSYDRLLITTETGTVFTMAQQTPLARPLDLPLRAGEPGLWVASSVEGEIQLQLWRGGTARWRRAPGGSWQSGEWSRDARQIRLSWVPQSPDSSVWRGQYDAPRAIIFEETFPGSGITIFRRQLR
jgi:hypothetical protein